MKHARLVLTVAAGLALVGCSSTPDYTVAEDEDMISMGLLGPAEAPTDLAAGEFHLGAGDELGQAVYTYYVAYLGADRQRRFATVESDAP